MVSEKPILILLALLVYCVSQVSGQLIFDDLETQASTKQPAAVKSTRPIASKFILLTTGTEIKLYPLHYTTDGQTLLSASSYLIRPKEFDVETINDLIENGYGSKFTRWFRVKQSQKSRSFSKEHPKTVSILPNRLKRIPSSQDDDKEDDENLNLNQQLDDDNTDEEISDEQSGWQQPWISDVDYFFDPSFCSGGESNNCLVVVWLDKHNKFIRFGSIDLSQNPVEISSGHEEDDPSNHSIDSDIVFETPKKIPTLSSRKKSSQHPRTLWLDEQSPIDICKKAARLDPRLIKECKPSGMFVDNVRGVLHVAFAASNHQASGDGILSAKLVPSRLNSVDDLELIRFNNCPTANNDSIDKSFDHPRRHFSFDSKSASWIFYLDKRNKGNVVALNLDDQFRRNSTKWASQSLVLDISKSSIRENVGAKTMTIDPMRHKLYWLLENNELYSSDYAGNQVELMERLSPKPVIRAPDMMQVFQGTIFINDLSKNSIISYKMKSSSLKTAEPQQQQQQIRSTHHVLIVEMRPIQGFRLIDMLEVLTEDTLDVEQDELVGLSDSVLVTEAPSWVDGLFKKFNLNSNVEKRSVFEQLKDRADKREEDYCPNAASKTNAETHSALFDANCYLIDFIWVLSGLSLLLAWKLYTMIRARYQNQLAEQKLKYEDPIKFNA